MIHADSGTASLRKRARLRLKDEEELTRQEGGRAGKRAEAQAHRNGL